MLQGFIRKSIGKSSSKQLRRDGFLTANIYAKGFKNIQLSFKQGDYLKEIRKKENFTFMIKFDNQELTVFIQDYQLHPINGNILHLDLRVSIKDQITNAMIPIFFEGIPKGLKNKGVLISTIKRLKVRGVVSQMPNKFLIKVDNLDLGDSLFVKDLDELENGCKIMEKDILQLCGVVKGK